MKSLKTLSCIVLCAACFVVNIYAENSYKIYSSTEPNAENTEVVPRDENIYPSLEINGQTISLTNLWYRAPELNTGLDATLHAGEFGHYSSTLFAYNDFLYVPIFKSNYLDPQRLQIFNAVTGDDLGIVEVDLPGDFAKRRYEEVGVDDAGNPWMISGLNHAVKANQVTTSPQTSEYLEFIKSKAWYLAIVGMDISNPMAPNGKGAVASTYKAKLPDEAELLSKLKYGTIINTKNIAQVIVSGVNVIGDIMSGNFKVYANMAVRNSVYNYKILMYCWSFENGNTVADPQLAVDWVGTGTGQATVKWVDENHFWFNSMPELELTEDPLAGAARFCELENENSVKIMSRLSNELTTPISGTAFATTSINGMRFIVSASQVSSPKWSTSVLDYIEHAARFSIHLLNSDGSPTLQAGELAVPESEPSLWIFPQDGILNPYLRPQGESLAAITVQSSDKTHSDKREMPEAEAHYADIFVYTPVEESAGHAAGATLAAYRLQATTPTGIENIRVNGKNNNQITFDGQRLRVNGDERASVSIHSINGQKLRTLDFVSVSEDLSQTLAPGIYIATSSNGRCLKIQIR